MLRLIFPALTLVLTLAATLPAAAKPALRDVAEIDDGLLALAIADDMRKRCDDVSARMIRALATVTALESRAKALGYSADEIEAHVTSKAEKKRLEARGESWLAERGVSRSDKSAYCALAREEVARDSAIGRLLRAR